MNRIHLLSIFYIFALCGRAQSEGHLFFNKVDIVEQIADKYAEKGNDESEKASFKQAVLEAFDNNWKKKNIKYGLNVSEINDWISQQDALKSEIVVLQESISELKETVNRDDGAKLQQDYANSLQEVSDADSLLSVRKEELASYQEEFKKKKKKLDDFKGGGNQYQTLLGGIEQEIEDAYKQSTGTLGTADVGVMKQAVADFDDNQSDLQSFFDASQYDSLVKKVKIIKGILPLCESVQNALEQMGNKKFDESANTKLKNAMMKAKVLMPSTQSKEYDEIMKALTDQKSSFKNLMYIINDIEESDDFPNVNVAESIEFAHNLMDNGKIKEIEGVTYYNKYYKVFNSVLDDIRKKVPSIKTRTEVGKYLNELKEKL